MQLVYKSGPRATTSRPLWVHYGPRSTRDGENREGLIHLSTTKDPASTRICFQSVVTLHSSRDIQGRVGTAIIH